MAQNQRASVTQVLVLGSIYQGANCGTVPRSVRTDVSHGFLRLWPSYRNSIVCFPLSHW